MQYSNGDKYQGMWVNDLREGEGVLNFATGDSYYGSWKDDLQCG